MAKYSRITGKVFGASASASGDNPEIGQFGSALAGTYNGTTDVATIQSLPAWSNGFIDAVTPTTQFPALPEMTGFGKVLSHQICYLLQQGVAEWDSGTTYYTNSWCSYNGSLYISKSDNNTNNAPTNVTYWTKFTGASSRNIGEYVTSSMPLNDSKLHLADGSQLSSVDYPEIFSYAASIYSTVYNWQALTQPFDIGYTGGGSNRVYGATFGNNIEMFICRDGTLLYHDLDYNYWSYAQNIFLSGTNWRGVAYGNNCFVAIDNTGHISKSISDSHSDVSSVWTQVVDLTESSWKSICYGNGKYVALSESGYISISSDDGTNWSTPASTITGGGSLVKMLYDGTKFITLSATGYISTSTDGSTWTTPTQIANLSSKTWVDFTYNDGKFTALSQLGYLSTSTDGSSWSVPSQENLPASTYIWTAIAPTEDGLFAVTIDGYVSEQKEEPISPFVTEADWQTINTAYGECGKYVYNAENNTLRIPKVNSYFKNTTTLSELGETNPASAPNIKGSGILNDDPSYCEGALYNSGIVSTRNSDPGGSTSALIKFDASRSNSIYSDSATTINTQSVSQYVYIVVSQ